MPLVTQEFLILIPTRDRVSRQITWDKLPDTLKKRTRLVVSEKEYSFHKKEGRNVISCPVQGKGMSVLRQWMMDFASRSSSKLIMLDDDLRFFRRREDMRITVSSPSEIEEAIHWLVQSLDEFVQCGLSERSFDWSQSALHKEDCKCIQAVGYNLNTLESSGARFDKEVPPDFFMEDYHMSIQLLKSGFSNRVSLVHRYSSVFNAPGGVSSFRSEESVHRTAHLLAELHEEVEVISRTYKSLPRIDVKIPWKKLRK